MLFRKNLNKVIFKRTIAVILAFCTVISFVQFTMLFCFANEKQMLHLKGNAYSTGIKIDPSKITVGNTYVVRFKYKFNNGDFIFNHNGFEDYANYNNIDTKVAFQLFIDRKRDAGYERMYTQIGKAGSGTDGWTYTYTNLNSNTIEFKFKVTTAMTRSYGFYYAGFWMSKGEPIDFYVSDMIMYDTSDADQKNILPDSITDDWAYINHDSAGRSGTGWTNPTDGLKSDTGSEFVDYDETLLIQKKILHLKGNAYSTGIKIDPSKITVGNTYVVRFKYKFNNGDFIFTHNGFEDAANYNNIDTKVAFHLFIDRKRDAGYERMYTQIGKAGSGTDGTTYTYTNLSSNTIEFKFKVTTAMTRSYGFYYAGFWMSKGEPIDFYVSDMIMYDTSDADQTNLLPDSITDDWAYINHDSAGRSGTGWTNPTEGLKPDTGSEFVDYDEKQMLHLKGNAYSTGIKIDPAKIEVGKTYAVKFKYKFNNGDFIFNHNGFEDAANYNNIDTKVAFQLFIDRQRDVGYERMYTQIGKVGSGTDGVTYTYTDLDSNTIEFKFKVTTEMTRSYGFYYAGFWMSKGEPIDFYVSDMIMYDTSDADQTNILPESIADNWVYMDHDSLGRSGTGWDNPTKGLKSGTGSEFVPYDETLFIPDDLEKQMLHLKGNAYSTGIKIDPAKIEVGKTYAVKFKYKFNNGDFIFTHNGFEDYANYNNIDTKVAFQLFIDRKRDAGYERMYTQIGKVGSGTDGVTYTYTDLDSNTIEFKFKVTTEMTRSYGFYYAGFWMSKGEPIDFYVSDMIMYDTSDADQTNILPESIADNWVYMDHDSQGRSGTGWDNPTKGLKSGTGSEFVPYDETLLIPDDLGKQMLHIEGGKYQTGIKIDPSKITVGNTYTVRFSYKFNRGAFKYDYETHVSNKAGYNALSDVVTFNLFHDRKTDHGAYQRMFAIVRKSGIGTNGSTYKVKQIDSSTLEFTFVVTDAMTYTGAGGSYYLGFWVSQGDVDLYVANMTMYDTSDADQKNILPSNTKQNWVYMPLDSLGMSGGSEIEGYGIPIPGLSSDSEFMTYDESLFPKTPVLRNKKMLRINSQPNSTFLGVALKKGEIKANVDYTISFKYHFENRDLDNGVACAVLYYDKNKQNGSAITSLAKVTNNKPGVVLDTDFDTKFKDGANAEYTFSLDSAMLKICNDQLYVGFNISAMDSNHVVGYIYDFKIYRTDDKEKANLLELDVYSDDESVWLGNWGLYKMQNYRRYVDYEESLFVRTSEENLYVDYTFNGDDGEWWKPSDVIVETDSDFETSTVKGRVTNKNGDPIIGAKLILKGVNNLFETKTVANGYYSFTDVPVDLYELYIVDGYGRQIYTGFSYFPNKGDTATVNIVCDSSKAVFYESRVTGSLNGNVYTPDLKTVGNIKLCLRNFGEVYTDSKGYFEFTDIPAGDYELYTILEDGSEYVFRTVTIKENVELAVKLKYNVVEDAPSTNNSLIWWIVAAGAVLVLGSGIAVFIILKRKKAKN